MLFQASIAFDSAHETVDVGQPFRIAFIDGIGVFSFMEWRAGFEQLCPIIGYEYFLAVRKICQEGVGTARTNFFFSLLKFHY